MQVHQSVFCPFTFLQLHLINAYIHRAEYYLFYLQFLLILKHKKLCSV